MEEIAARREAESELAAVEATVEAEQTDAV
jgi:hypothetical protein